MGRMNGEAAEKRDGMRDDEDVGWRCEIKRRGYILIMADVNI